jgi:hypothetical protein
VHLFFSIGAESPNGNFSVITKRHVHTFPHIGTPANEELNADLRKKETLWVSHVRETKSPSDIGCASFFVQKTPIITRQNPTAIKKIPKYFKCLDSVLVIDM